jgi:hypothetical protein
MAVTPEPELSPEQEQVAEVVERRVLHRVARWLWRRSTIRAIGYTLFVVMLTLAGWLVVRNEITQNCRARREARTAIIDLVHLAVQDAKPDNPFVVRVLAATKPGGPLAPIDC